MSEPVGSASFKLSKRHSYIMNSEKQQILVIDDEPSIRELLEVSLRKDGFAVTCAESGEKGLELARRINPNLIILDIMLPGTDGFDVCRSLRSNPSTSHILIVMLSAMGEEADVVTGLELGADDYVTKPFSPRVIRARVKALLRRGRPRKNDLHSPISIHDLFIHPGRHEVSLGAEQIALTPTEFRVLFFLASQPGWVFTRYQIVDGVKGPDCAVTDRSVDVQIVSLRRKLLHAGDYIETVRGVGYRFREEE